MKNRYALNLVEHTSASPETGLSVSSPATSQLLPLAELMLDAYKNTIDSEDETLDDAIDEVQSFFDSQALLNESVLLSDERGLNCACLVSYLEGQKAPLVAYIMTAARVKANGLARVALQESLHRLKLADYTKVLAAITDGNVPSEKLFKSFNFKQLQQ